MTTNLTEVELPEVDLRDDDKSQLDVEKPHQGSSEDQQLDKSRSLCFLISLIVLWGFAFWTAGAEGALLLPLVFIPSLFFLALWKVKGEHVIGYHSLVHAYSLAFCTGSFIIFIFKVFLLIFLFYVVWGNSDFRYWAYVVIFSFLGVGLAPELLKYKIATVGRSMRPDLTHVEAYLWYTTAGALGFSTFTVVLDSFFLLRFSSSSTQFLFICVRMLLEIPMHCLTGYYIGIGVAKNEILQWGSKWYSIIWLTVLVRTFAAMIFRLGIDYNWSFAAIFFVGYRFEIVALAIWIARRNLPSSFARLNDDEEFGHSPMPDTL